VFGVHSMHKNFKGPLKIFFYNVFRLPTITPPTPVRASQAR
jgi:hypothetical protein